MGYIALTVYVILQGEMFFYNQMQQVTIACNVQNATFSSITNRIAECYYWELEYQWYVCVKLESAPSES